ncbi:patatin like phospholipase domain containing sws isoform X3 [Tachypleus tridentatus]|uniref:patatin like phospholipase domain containing sws isoform X3 n=1 Tax=Tachypleus tridentatus TaxID=6853 RepID=UPI003FD4FD9C
MSYILNPMDYLNEAGIFDCDSILYKAWPASLTYVLQNYLVTIVILSIVSVAGFLWFIYAFRNIKTKVEKVTARMMDPSRPRFRKRDKVLFYGRKMLRKVRSFSREATGGRTRLKKRQVVLRFAKRLLRIKREQPLTLQVKEPSQAFLEEDISDQGETRLPPEVIYMLKSIRVFGFFEKPLFLELCKHIESRFISSGQLLFSIGDQDDSIYVVQSGRLSVFITEHDGTELLLKDVTSGESIASLLSIMDVLSGHQADFKTVSARAIEDTSVLRLQVEVFKHLLEKYPESLLRVTQVIMVRLQRVTFTALHNYLDLTTQLVRQPHPVNKRHPLPTSPKFSPSRQPSLKTSLPHDEKESPTKPIVTPLGENSSVEKTVTFAGYSGSDDEETSEEVIRSSESTSNVDVLKNQTVPEKTLSHTFQKKGKEVQESHHGTCIVTKKKPSFFLHREDENDILTAAVQGFMHVLGIEDESLLKGRVSVKEVPASVCVLKEGCQEDTALFYVICGGLVVTQKSVDKDEQSTLHIAHSGEAVGGMAVITGEPSLFSITTRLHSKIGVISAKNTYEILRERPLAVLNLVHTVMVRLSSFVRQIDFALDWMNVESGRALYRQDDISDCMYIVLSGRLRSVLTRQDGKKELAGEYGRGDLVGIVEVLTQTARATTVMAVRDSELAKLPEGLLNAIKIKYPVVVTRLIKLLGHRILGTLQKGETISGKAATIGSRPFGCNFATVAILSVSDDVPLYTFTMELYHSLTTIGPTLMLTSDFIRTTLGSSALEGTNEYRLCSWLGQQEDQHRIVLYQCDSRFSTWTQRCIRQADCILIVGLADQEPTVGEVERQLENLAVRTQKELILLHREGNDKPRNTVEWLNIRSWCSSHHHIQCPKRMFTKKSRSRLKEMYNKLFESAPNIHSDFSRLSRFLTGTSIGLVLGGGGARGSAHVGMIRAIQEAGIPIDMVGGVSIGAFMGALWCQEKDVTTFIQKAREWSMKMTSYWRTVIDLTYPMTAMFTGSQFNHVIHEVFGERQIEDLWLPFFTVTTDITESCMRVHTHGSLWRYVRSSMSLSGYMPPLCDPIDGHLLLDGGYVNNLPADVMRERGAETIIAIDVGSQDEQDLTNYGDTLNGWWLLWKRWNPWSSPVRVPSLPEIQSRLAYVSCVRQLEQVKRSDYCTYVRPPIDKYKTLQFGCFDEIMEVGFQHGKALFTTLKHGHKSLHSFLHHEKTEHYHQQKKSLHHASFTDLAAMVCQIQEPRRSSLYDAPLEEAEEDEADEREAGYSSEPETNFLGELDKNQKDLEYSSEPEFAGNLPDDDDQDDMSPIHSRKVVSSSHPEYLKGETEEL